MKTIYLCGGINNLSDSECKDWRELVKQKLRGQYDFLDPMRRGGIEKDSVEEIVEFDKDDILDSNIVLVNANKPSWGTAMEIMYAWNIQEIYSDTASPEILTVCDSDRPSPWLIYHSDQIFKTFDEAINSLKQQS